MYFESNRSAEDGMLAVGTVVANRLRSGRYGANVCSIVGQRGQFAPGVMSRKMDGDAAERARRIAEAVLNGQRHPGVRDAMFFHTAGLHFGYGNMHYVLVAGGNAFYEKRGRGQTGRLINSPALAYAQADSTTAKKNTPFGPDFALHSGQRPADQPRVIAMSDPVQASMLPVSRSAAEADPNANVLVSQAWSAFAMARL